jgi:hypothetical protein
VTDEKLALAMALESIREAQAKIQRDAILAGARGDLMWNNRQQAYKALVVVLQQEPVPWARYKIRAMQAPLRQVQIRRDLGEEVFAFVAALPDEVAERCIKWALNEDDERRLAREQMDPGPKVQAPATGEAEQPKDEGGDSSRGVSE